jgi:hypothetical protein
MRFLTYDSDASWDAVTKYHEKYASYLATKAAVFPAGAYAFATATWHYDPSDHRCPHDAWLDELTIEEKVDASEEVRVARIVINLRGAYHNGTLDIVYEKVHGYDLRYLDPERLVPGRAHGDWLLDEIRLADDGRVEHEINFSRNGNWVITCEDISAIWTPD